MRSHIIIGLQCGDGYVEWYGFYPGTGGGSSGSSSSGRIRGPGAVVIGDVPKKGGPESSVMISLGERIKIQKWIARSAIGYENGTGRQYDLRWYNCADWAVAVIQGGLGEARRNVPQF